MTHDMLPRIRRFKTPVLLLSFLFLLSCVAPRPVSRLTPHADKGHYKLGREYITLQNDSIYVIAAFDENRQEDLIFDVIIMNRSDRTLELDPANFYALVLENPSADSSVQPPLRAADPEKVIMNIEKARAVEYAEKKTNAIWGVLEATAGVVSTAAAVASDADAGEVAWEAINTMEGVGYHLAVDQEIEDHLHLINDDKLYWKNDVLRRNTLKPGTVVEGFVYFPRSVDAEYYMMCYPLGDQLFQFVYRQGLYYP